MTDHCFISYSTIDALEFARKLATELEGGDDQYIDAWFDKRDLKAGIDWRIQLPEAIRECKVLLFVMTRDSVDSHSMTNEEWAFALKYKKPIIPLRLHKETDLPFGLGRRQWIDFTGEFYHGLAQLRKRLADLDSPKGQLQLMRDRLADAERDLSRAIAEDEVRIKAEIEQLKNDIRQQDIVVKNPDYAEKRTRKNINAGLQEERKTVEIKPQTSNTKFVNPIPLVAPNYFQGRLPELSQIADFLKNDYQRILTIIGRGGGGKTALSCYLLKSLELGRLPENLGEFKVDGIVYLSEIGSHKVSFANIYSGLTQLLSYEVASKLDLLYRQPKISVVEKTRQLLESFQQEKIIVLLDNFELFVETETENLIDIELKEALETILRSSQHLIKIIITTRVPARDLALIEPSRHNNLHLEEGLKTPYAENILRAMDKDGRAGFKDASDEQLGRARELTLGYPRALESLYAIISVDRYTSIEELLAVELPETVVENLVGEAFSRLDITAQKVMQALAVYNRPVPPAAIDYLLQQHVPGINSSPILTRLVSMHFARREAGRFYLHPVDREYAFRRIPEGESGKRVGKGARSRIWDQYALILRAADYFVESRKPETEWKKIDDLSAQLAEFDLRVIAEDYDAAASILSDLGSDYLKVWGHYQLILDLGLSIEKKIKDVASHLYILNIIGIAYIETGRVENSNKYYQQALHIARVSHDRVWEAITLGNIGGVYSELGNFVKAIEYLEKSLQINRETKNELGEAHNLGNLGVAYSDLGDFKKAIELHKQELSISQKHGSQQASESVSFENIGDCLLELNDIDESVNYYQKAIQISTKLNYIQTQCYARWGLAQAYLLKDKVEEAQSIIAEARSYNSPQITHNILALQGIISLRRNDPSFARRAFELAIAHSDEILFTTPEYYDAVDAKALAMCGLGLLGEKHYIIAAKETFRKARKITSAEGIVKRVLRLFDELSKADPEGIISEIRAFAEGKE